jgi:hypothetical protein
MKVCRLANLLLLTSFLSWSFCTSAAEPLLPSLECGDYEMSGYLSRNPAQQLTLRLRPGTSSSVEFVVVKAPFDATLERVGTLVTVQVYVPQRVHDYGRAAIVIEKFLPKKKTAHEELRKLASRACMQPSAASLKKSKQK